jgi:hypothetical protein
VGRGGIAGSALEKGGEQGANLHELLVNKGWKGKKAESRRVISHCLKQAGSGSTKLIF